MNIFNDKIQITNKIDIINHQTPNNKETKIYKAKIRRNIKEKKKIYNHCESYVNISLRIFYQGQKK